MKKLMLLFLLFFSCDKEEKIVYHQIEISNSLVPGHFMHQSAMGIEYFYPTDPSGVLNGVYYTDEYTWSVYSGAGPPSVTAHLIFFPGVDNVFGCISVVVTTYINGVNILEESFELGQMSANPNVYCSLFGNSFTYEFVLAP